MTVSIEIEGPLPGQSSHAERVLRALPAWFGIESAIVQYVKDVAAMPTFLARVEREMVGFLTVHRHFEVSAEVHVVGVLPGHHRAGIGRELQNRAEEWLRDEGVEYLQVKTVSASSDDPNYALTRKFYAAMGFRPLEEIKTLWDERNPCLILVKRLAP